MDHIQVVIPVADTTICEVLIAKLIEIGFEGFEEAENNLIAYVTEDNFLPEKLQSILPELFYSIHIIKQQNWNAIWEKNFEPVIVEDFCTIRADFHDIEINTPYEIIITPKMSFGTGHHATTRLMMTQMKDIDFSGKTVLDFGTGTGILAMLAEKLGAIEILAIDNDEWSYINAEENILRNNCKNIVVKQSSLELIADKKFDVILANINRNILLEYMALLKKLLNKEGLILMSGLMLSDKEIILEAAMKTGLIINKSKELNNWIALMFTFK